MAAPLGQGVDRPAGFPDDQDRDVVHAAPHRLVDRELGHGSDPVPALGDDVRDLFGVVGAGCLAVGQVTAQHAAERDRRQAEEALTRQVSEAA
ncbi:hypothetical protein [Streptomyces sp. enrichment culture]|uniref:hypothetical protein n=1 Tax=Streptomyces sp. enrichment culture TaxID=1795815 RepID=UPI003F55BDF4